jgi:hypothetical protein
MPLGGARSTLWIDPRGHAVLTLIQPATVSRLLPLRQMAGYQRRAQAVDNA